MADRALARYIPLSCGHLCPAEVEILFRGLGTRGTVMCERCGEFKPVREVKKEKTSPGQPMF